MIKQLTVKNYRSLADVKIDLEPVTVLVGANGSGKSNIVDVLRFVRDALQMGLDAAVVNRHGMGTIRRWSAKGRPFDVEISLQVEAEKVRGTYQVVLGSERRGEYGIKREVCNVRDARDYTREALYAAANGKWVNPPQAMQPAIQERSLVLPLLSSVPVFEDLYHHLVGCSFYNIMPQTLSEAQKPGNDYPLEEHGGNLASTLRSLQRAPGTSFALLEAIRGVLPNIEDFQVSQVSGYLITRLRHSDLSTDRDALFELSQESDGTLRLLGILTALYQNPPRTLLALEEPELTIHPGALKSLWEEIEATSRTSQILLTTHSPDLLDLCKAEQIRVVEKVEGVTQVGPIADDQKQMIQQRLFHPGELLRAQGLMRAEQGELFHDAE
jgi:predicted ATPase